jgi:hypothetical protein
VSQAVSNTLEQSSMTLQQFLGIELPIQALMAGVQAGVLAMAPLRAKAATPGGGDLSLLWADQNTTGCKAIPAGMLTPELADGLTGTR